jgi:protein-S-isoprenylcysteine O-methyltransferase Ste14
MVFPEHSRATSLHCLSFASRKFCHHQLISWLFLILSIVLSISGFVLLHRLGEPQPVSRNSPEFTFENTSNLITTGAYRYIRHPLYASLLLLSWGVLLKAVSLPTLLVAAVATASLVATAKAEERENLARFGPAYKDYVARTHRFIPFLFWRSKAPAHIRRNLRILQCSVSTLRCLALPDSSAGQFSPALTRVESMKFRITHSPVFTRTIPGLM